MGLESPVKYSAIKNFYSARSFIGSLIRLRLKAKSDCSVLVLNRLYAASSRQGSNTVVAIGSASSLKPSNTNSNSTSTSTSASTNSTVQSVPQLLQRNLSTAADRNKYKTNSGEEETNKKMKNAVKNIAAAAVFFSGLILEESYMVNRGKGVTRYDMAQLPSNNPIEDAKSEKIVQVPIIDDKTNQEVNTDWMFWGVFDGHAGWNTSAKLKDELIDHVINQLDEIYKFNPDRKLRIVPSSETIDDAIKSGFLKLDDEIVNKSIEKLFNSTIDKTSVANLLMPALSGSCGLLSFYDTHSKILKVAVAGDSRALLGSLNEDGSQWTVNQLSIDQTGSNPEEVERIKSEHPNEPNAIRNGRILGSLEPSRSFGDARYKWSADIQAKVYNKFFGRKSPPNLESPPYVTAEPVITTTKIDESKNQFLVMASDGLYEMLTNEEIVGLVVRWTEKNKFFETNNRENIIQTNNTSSSFVQNFKLSYFTGEDKKLPKVVDLTATPESSKQAFRRTNTNQDFSYILEDNNVSTHLIRNALSNGGSKEHCEMLSSIPSPLSRRYRDDLTVIVVFFGKDRETPNDEGRLEMNTKATNEKGGYIAPKL
ncbi:hypothetical protein PACTADRAFT_49449 [Pachysolen tannophilus NRRL Y-2460]|uniref:PPM-type phosphatase domain-containing protein n=1 Tax=Pachysolen tannophilus NRRL Y-2460 TaxID=669874 RepID=A0A1E4TWC1_PACTA|nr:hypothetical protein PACTADRAFT_49449 [Pachysolen tannophilus NRRL Y-2460]